MVIFLLPSFSLVPLGLVSQILGSLLLLAFCLVPPDKLLLAKHCLPLVPLRLRSVHL